MLKIMEEQTGFHVSKRLGMDVKVTGEYASCGLCGLTVKQPKIRTTSKQKSLTHTDIENRSEYLK